MYIRPPPPLTPSREYPVAASFSATDVSSLSAFREPINTDSVCDPIDRCGHDSPVTFSFAAEMPISPNERRTGCRPRFNPGNDDERDLVFVFDALIATWCVVNSHASPAQLTSPRSLARQ